jgi:hypothetical protein
MDNGQRGCVDVLVPETSREELEKIVDEDIADFEKWFCENVDTSAVALTGMEKSIVKTYLWYKTHRGEVPSGTTSSG